MLGHVFVVEDAKDLAQIVRDVTRYGGAYRPEVSVHSWCFFSLMIVLPPQDIYEFIQRRSDWKKIEKTVDKTMYSLSFKEDCVICWICSCICKRVPFISGSFGSWVPDKDIYLQKLSASKLHSASCWIQTWWQIDTTSIDLSSYCNHESVISESRRNT